MSYSILLNEKQTIFKKPFNNKKKETKWWFYNIMKLYDTSQCSKKVCILLMPFFPAIHIKTIDGSRKVLLHQWLTREAGWRFFFLSFVHYNYVLQTVSCIRILMNNNLPPDSERVLAPQPPRGKAGADSPPLGPQLLLQTLRRQVSAGWSLSSRIENI